MHDCRTNNHTPYSLRSRATRGPVAGTLLLLAAFLLPVTAQAITVTVDSTSGVTDSSKWGTYELGLNHKSWNVYSSTLMSQHWYGDETLSAYLAGTVQSNLLNGSTVFFAHGFDGGYNLVLSKYWNTTYNAVRDGSVDISGAFYWAYTVAFTPRSVPDSSATLPLFGLALIGLSLARKRIARQTDND